MLEGFILSASDVTGTDYGTAWSTCWAIAKSVCRKFNLWLTRVSKSDKMQRLSRKSSQRWVMTAYSALERFTTSRKFLIEYQSGGKQRTNKLHCRRTLKTYRVLRKIRNDANTNPTLLFSSRFLHGAVVTTGRRYWQPLSVGSRWTALDDSRLAWSAAVTSLQAPSHLWGLFTIGRTTGVGRPPVVRPVLKVR